jgi:hypothetical protein
VNNLSLLFFPLAIHTAFFGRHDVHLTQEREPRYAAAGGSSEVCGTPSFRFGWQVEVPQDLEAGAGSADTCFVIQEAVLQHLARLLLPRPIRVLKSLAHLLESGCIDVASCVPLTQDL